MRGSPFLVSHSSIPRFLIPSQAIARLSDLKVPQYYTEHSTNLSKALLLFLTSASPSNAGFQLPTLKFRVQGWIMVLVQTNSYFQGELDKDAPCPHISSFWQLSFQRAKLDTTRQGIPGNKYFSKGI